MQLARSVRWLLLPFVSWLGFYLAINLSILALVSFKTFCGESWAHSLFCRVGSHVDDALAVTLGSALAAALVILFPTLLAPSNRFAVASAFYGLGVLATIWLALPVKGFGLPDTPIAALIAVATGALTVLWVKHNLE